MNATPVPVAHAVGHPLIARLLQRLDERASVDAPIGVNTKLAAVVAVIRVTREPELLFIKRAEAAHDPWSGHIAFPGGRREPADVSLEATAVRETLEEVALDLSMGRILGRLDDLASSPALPPLVIRPFVAVVQPLLPFALSREVADAFWVPLSLLRAPDTQIAHERRVSNRILSFPAYSVNGHVVWGLTERIVRQLLTLFD